MKTPRYFTTKRTLLSQRITPRLNTTSIMGSGDQRYFRTNDDLSYISIPEVTFSGDFEIEALVYSQENGLSQIMLGLAGSSSNFINLTSTGNIVYTGSDGVSVTSTATVSRGVLSNIKVMRVSGTVSIYINGVLSGSGSASGMSISMIGAWGGNSNLRFNGIIANVRMYDNGTLVRNYPINDNSNIIANAAASLGPELVTNGDFSDGTNGWTGGGAVLSIDSMGRLVVTSTGGGPRAVQSVETIVGRQYLLEFTYQRGTTVNLNLVRIGTQNNGSGFTTPITSNGRHYIFFTATATTHYLNFGYGETANGQTSIWDDITFREAEGYGSVVNGNASDWELFNQQADGGYLGQNLLPQINFLAGQGWLTSSLAVRGTETEFSVTALGGLAYDNLLQVGNEYRLRIAANNTPDTFQAWNSLLVAANLIGNITASISTYDFTALDDALYLRTTEAASYQNVELDIKRLLRTA